MPSPASDHGTASVVMMALNARGNPVHSMTITKMSHTWLASQTGPIERSIWRRARSAISLRPAVRSHTPAP